MKDYKDLKRFAEALGFFVTSTNGGRHNRGSSHYLGLAIDTRTRDHTDAENDLFIRKCRALGIAVRDERVKPANQAVWNGAHLHLQIGTKTLETLRQFQKQNGLIADGIVGAKTLAVLNRVVV